MVQIAAAVTGLSRRSGAVSEAALPWVEYPKIVSIVTAGNIRPVPIPLRYSLERTHFRVGSGRRFPCATNVLVWPYPTSTLLNGGADGFSD